MSKELCADLVTIETDFQESVWCCVKLRNNDTLLICCLYRSPNCSDENFRYLLHTLDTVKEMRQSHKIIMGDFNFRDINWSDMTTAANEQHSTTLFIESIRVSCLFQQVTKPTHIRENNEPSILDLIFTNEEEMVSDLQYDSSLGKVIIWFYLLNLIATHLQVMRTINMLDRTFSKGITSQ